MLRQIALRNFRNYERETFEFTTGINTIAGPNGIGKTNLLEALYLLSTGRSFCTSHLTDLIRHGESAFMVEATFEKDGISQSLSFSFDGTAKRILSNEAPLHSQGELLGILPSVLYAPRDIALISGSPSERRRFLNIHIAQFDPMYVHHLLRYSRAMKHRNALLKIKSEAGIEVWEHEMETSADYLMNKRKKTLSTLHLKNDLSDEEFFLEYKPSYLNFESRSKDLLYGTTTHGPHRDDILFMQDGREAKLFSSEGQKRTCITALRLAQLKDVNGIFCIDDFGMHLDPTRQEMLTKKLSKLDQVILTIPRKDLNKSFAAFAAAGIRKN